MWQGLRKVSDAEKAKNLPSRTGLVPAKLKPLDGSQSKEGKTELVMERKWSIENHKGIEDIEIEGTPRQSVYIYKCDDCVVKVIDHKNRKFDLMLVNLHLIQLSILELLIMWSSPPCFKLD